MAETLAMEARLKDFMSANLDTIIKKLDETAKKADSTGNSLSSMAAKAETSLGKFSFTLGHTNKAVEEIGKKTEEAANKTENGFMKMAASVFSANTAFEIAKRAIGLLVTQVTDGVKKYDDYVRAGAKMEAVLRATDNAVGLSVTSLRNMAKALSENDLITEADALSAESLLLVYTKIGRDIFPRVIEAADDLSEVMGVDLQGATRALAMALDNPQEGLRRLQQAGIKFTVAQRDMIDAMIAAGKSAEAQDYILTELEGKVKGVSAAIAATDVGQLEMAKKQMGEIAKTVAKDLIPVMTELNKEGRDVLQWLSDMITGYKVFAGIRLDDPIKDLTLLNEEIAKWEKTLQGKQNANWFSKAITNMPVEIKMVEDKIAALKAQKTALQSEVDAIINPGKLTPTTEKIEDAKAKTPEQIAAAEKLKNKKEAAEQEWLQEKNIESANFSDRLKAQRENQLTAQKLLEESNKTRLAMMDSFTQASIKAMPSEAAQERAQLAIDIEEKKNAIFAFETFTINSKEQAAEMRIKLAEYERTQLKAIDEKEAKDNKEINDKKVKQEQQTADLKVEILKSLQNSTMEIMNLAKGRNREVFNVFKAMSIAEATISTAVSAVKAFQAGMSSGGGIASRLALAIGGAAAAGIAGGIQIATISAQKYAVGTSRAPAGMAMVGEQGPELLELPLGTRVHSALDTRQIVNNSNTSTNNSGGNVLNVTVNDQTTGKALTDMIRSGELDTFIIDFKRRGNLR